MDSLLVINFILLSFGTVVNILGLVLLHRARRTKFDKQQRLILMSLSFSECFLCVIKAIQIAFEEFKVYQLDAMHVINIFHSTSGYAFYLTMIFLTLDRFLKFHLSLRYQSYRTKKQTMVALSLLWTASFAATLTQYFTKQYKYFFILDLSFDIIFLMVSVTTYLYGIMLSYRLRKIRRIPGCDIKQQHVWLKGFLMVSIIISTFTVFIVIPDLAYGYAFFIDNSLLSNKFNTVMSVIYYLAFITDPVIYVLLSPAIRNVIYRKKGQRLTQRTFQTQLHTSML